MRNFEQSGSSEQSKFSNEKVYMEYGELSEEEKERAEIIDRQFSNPSIIEIPNPENKSEQLSIEYVVLDAHDKNESHDTEVSGDRTVVHIPGFTSSYRSPEKFVKLMALREKKRVIVISLPSTGNSSSAPSDWRKNKSGVDQFSPFAEVVNETIEAIREQEKVVGDIKTTNELSLVSSSMGSIIATEMAVRHPDKVRDLVLLHPAGIDEGNFLKLAKRYVNEQTTDKKILSRSVRMEPQYKEELERAYQELFGKSLQKAYTDAGGEGKFDLQDSEDQAHKFSRSASADILKDGTINTIKNPLWRAWEALGIARGGLLRKLPEVKANTYIINGGDDRLFSKEQFQNIESSLGKANSVEIDQFQGMRHESIYHDARRYSSSVGSFLDNARLKEKNK